jgi:predicted transcriptional regulator
VNSISKDNVHPNAYLHKIKNVAQGLKARTRILSVLDEQYSSAAKIVQDTALKYSVVLHHLRLLEKEGIVHHKGNRRYVWSSTGFGQKRLS